MEFKKNTLNSLKALTVKKKWFLYVFATTFVWVRIDGAMELKKTLSTP